MHHLCIEKLERLTPRMHGEAVALCTAAYEQPFEPHFEELKDAGAVHLLGRHDGRLVTHLAWVERRLQTRDGLTLRTAYVEAVATLPEMQRRGWASALLRRFVDHVGDFQVAALSPSDAAFYARLGWEPWRGPLFQRRGDRWEPTPDEEMMIHRLPATPALALDAPISVEWRPGEVW
ncbi:Aminoglycoside 2'-N-acetyltransferase [Rhodovulum sp. PH10]|uniref:GNAT family N-acetyltransferase n=1 Tax=Rhodovulum sp. PH10 TaxID=1187851 RepID=UPI00027C2156|nr:GNAT family N-acetyltransferase [Rhodovulum sp. PH10]EJW13559.1 Aminoglycoside 2'-N-acetyltransferase [Rhodovulum sp. PH10]